MRPLKPLWDLLVKVRPSGVVARFRRWRAGRGKAAHDAMLKRVEEYVRSLPDEPTPTEKPSGKRK